MNILTILEKLAGKSSQLEISEIITNQCEPFKKIFETKDFTQLRSLLDSSDMLANRNSVVQIEENIFCM